MGRKHDLPLAANGHNVVGTGCLFVAVGIVAAVGCRRGDDSSGPPVCSDAGKRLLSSRGVAPEVIAAVCNEVDGAIPTAQAPVAVAPQEHPPDEDKAAAPPPWKIRPTPLSEMRADPSSFVNKPILVYVTVSPSDYYNFGYAGARGTHFSFGLHNLDDETGKIEYDTLYGYADKKRFRPFFSDVTKSIREQKKEQVDATLYVTYLARRYDGASAGQMEIVNATLGRDPTLAPAPPSPPH